MLKTWKKTLKLFKKVSSIVINAQKSTLTTSLLDEAEEHRYVTIFPFKIKQLDEGLEYLGFHLKPNGYKKND